MKGHPIWAAAALSACAATGPHMEPYWSQTADLAAAPGDYRAAALAYLQENFSQAEGAQLRGAGAPYRAQARINGLPWAGWAADVTVRAKMPNGRYSAFRPYTVLYQDGRAVALSQDATEFTPLAKASAFSVSSR